MALCYKARNRLSLEERPKGLTSKEKLRRSVDDLKKELTVLEKTVLTENRDKPREVQRVDEEKGQSYQMIRQFIEQEIVSKAVESVKARRKKRRIDFFENVLGVAVNIKRPRTYQNEREADVPDGLPIRKNVVRSETSSDDENASGSEADTEFEESAEDDEESPNNGVKNHPKMVLIDSQSTQTEVQILLDNWTQVESPTTDVSISTQTDGVDDNTDENHNSGVENRPNTVSVDSQSTQTDVQLFRDNFTQAESPPTCVNTSTQTVEVEDSGIESHNQDDVTGVLCQSLPETECSIDTLPSRVSRHFGLGVKSIEILEDGQGARNGFFVTFSPNGYNAETVAALAANFTNSEAEDLWMLDKVVQVRVCKRSSLKDDTTVSPADESSKEALELHKQLSEVKKAIQQAKFMTRWEDAQLAFELDALWHLTKDRHPLLLDKFKFRIASFVNGNLKNFPTMGLVHLLTKSKLVRASRIFKPCIRLLTSKTTPPITDIT